MNVASSENSISPDLSVWKYLNDYRDVSDLVLKYNILPVIYTDEAFSLKFLSNMLVV